MKKIIVLVVLYVVKLFSVEWYGYEEAVKMIYVERTNCRYCINMHRDVFDDKEMSQWIEERFIPVKLNLDMDDLPLDISVSMTPSFYFVNKDQKIIKMIPGSWSGDDFKSLIKNIKEP
jgi:thioredoxin-related protein